MRRNSGVVLLFGFSFKWCLMVLSSYNGSSFFIGSISLDGLFYAEALFGSWVRKVTE